MNAMTKPMNGYSQISWRSDSEKFSASAPIERALVFVGLRLASLCQETRNASNETTAPGDRARRMRGEDDGAARRHGDEGARAGPRASAVDRDLDAGGVRFR